MVKFLRSNFITTDFIVSEDLEKLWYKLELVFHFQTAGVILGRIPVGLTLVPILLMLRVSKGWQGCHGQGKKSGK